MKTKPRFDHDTTGHMLAEISEKLRICLGEQISYCPPSHRYRTISRCLDFAVSQVDALRDHFKSMAYHELSGDLPYRMYHPTVQEVDFTPCLFTKTPDGKPCHRFDIRSEKRKQGYPDKPLRFSTEDRVDANIWLFSAAETIAGISHQTHQAFSHSTAKEARDLCAKALRAILTLEAEISNLPPWGE